MEKKTYKVAVTWTSTGIFHISAQSLEEAIQMAYGAVPPQSNLLEGGYMDDTLVVDVDQTWELNEGDETPTEVEVKMRCEEGKVFFLLTTPDGKQSRLDRERWDQYTLADALDLLEQAHNLPRQNVKICHTV